MLIGFSHLTYNCSNADKKISELINKGYKIDFEEKNISNNVLKKPFLKHYAPNHDITLLKHNDEYSIELINHNVLEFDIQDRIEYGKDIIVFVNDQYIEREFEFWELLGLTVNRPKISLKRPIKNWCLEFNIIESNKKLKEQKLDLKGITSFVFIVKNITDVKDKIKSKVKVITNIFDVYVNKKNLNIFFVESPSGLIIELIEVKDENN